MRNLIKIVLSLAAVSALTVVGFSSVARRADDVDRRIRSEALEARAHRTDRDLNRFAVQAKQDSTRIAWLLDDVARTEQERDAAVQGTREALAYRASTYAAIEVDALSPDALTVIAAERGVVESYQEELVVERKVNAKLVAALAVSQRSHGEAVSLLWGVTAERDSAMVLLKEYQNRLDFSLFRLLFQDLPRKAACAAGGATVAAVNKGDVLLGAGIGLVACLVMESIL